MARRVRQILAPVLVCGAVVLSATAGIAAEEKQPPWDETFNGHEMWTRNIDSAFAVSKAANKPLLVDFYQLGCGPCRALAESTWADPKFQAWAKAKYILAEGNVAETPELRKRFNIVGTPTVLVCKPGGEEIDRMMGFRRTGEFIATVENYEKGIGTLAALLAEEKSRASDPQFLYRLAASLQAHFRLDEADSHFAAVVALDPENKSGKADSAVLDMAWNLRKRDDWKGAAAKCRELVQRWPSSDLADDATVSIGWYASKAGMKDEAIAAFREYLQKWPNGEDTAFAREQIIELQKPPEADSGQ